MDFIEDQIQFPNPPMLSKITKLLPRHFPLPLTPLLQRKFAMHKDNQNNFTRVSERVDSSDKNYRKFLNKKKLGVKLDNIQDIYKEKFPIAEFEPYKADEYMTEERIQLLKTFIEGFGAQSLHKGQ